MAKEITIEYRGHAITYHEGDEMWQVSLKGGRRPHQEKNLKTLKAAIDRTFRKDFKPMEAYMRKSGDRWGFSKQRYQFEKVLITGIRVDGMFDIKKGGKRTTTYGDFYEITPANEKKMAELGKVVEDLDRFEKRKNELDRSLKSIDTAKLKKDVLGKED
jgi:hypothetical protein